MDNGPGRLWNLTMRIAARVDRNQAALVKALRQVPGVSVEPGHDDLLIGYKGRTYWVEVKAQEVISAKTARVRASEITPSEARRLANWTGQYALVWNIEQILEIIFHE